ncbi:DNA-binding response regulator [Antarcticibacterium flavum]|uniref:DNA-binding response regulator n=1 Tax=Antarcticibacterium flavum TaxID=2058175 RepID=A0A5B7X273_9FLAO|nr:MULTISPECIES: LuxR family transcriptional regulator [Antarcticibacterium]MCM4161120.1 DNA-binding response regulator [Antarcticibacterium sp. W02-3]QCY69380.1 DNA-binding response regulator [Antarcticibacterium flavum]
MSKSKQITNFWREEYSREVKKYDPFKVTQQFKKMAGLFTPGTSYFYILNVHDLELDYISPDVELLTGIHPKNVTIEKLLKTATPRELEWVQKKEVVVRDFYGRFLPREKITDYKLVYSYEMKDRDRKKRIMLHQATPLSISESGGMQHVLSIHTDISHLTSKSSHNVSFIDLEGRQSFYNIDPEKGVFDPEFANSKCHKVLEKLTDREQEILDLLAKGLSAKQIAGNLNISEHTVKTHRKNILKKTGCNKTAELIAERILTGLIM